VDVLPFRSQVLMPVVNYSYSKQIQSVKNHHRSVCFLFCSLKSRFCESCFC